VTDLRVRAAQLAPLVLERTVELARIPAPSGLEERRAALVADWWRSDGWGNVRIDATGNVRAQVRAGSADAVVVCAHLDTVFPIETSHEPRTEGARLVGPSVGDDSVAVAALSAMGTLLSDRRGGSVWIVATVGEEGLGNLRGIRAILADPPAPVRALLAVEGNYLGRVSTRGVGSIRWRVPVRGPGGHAWERAGAPSAVHAAARIVVALSELHPDGAATTVNVGRIAGGEAINARARDAWFEVDMRSDEPSALVALETQARAILDAPLPGVQVDVEELGRRPAGGLDPGDPLVLAAMQSLSDLGIPADLVATSTDANAAHAAGISALALGITEGAGEHTADEWIDTTRIPAGLAALAGTVTRFEAGR
jgi:tripeptide aminopeptidase